VRSTACSTRSRLKESFSSPMTTNRRLVSPNCYQITAADLTLDREAKCFEVALDRSIKARLWSPLVWHGSPMPELDEHQVSCAAGAKAAAKTARIL
jgi:hypothetical protein